MRCKGEHNWFWFGMASLSLRDSYGMLVVNDHTVHSLCIFAREKREETKENSCQV